LGGGAVYSREDQQKWFAEMGMNWKENPEETGMETGMEKSGGNRNRNWNGKIRRKPEWRVEFQDRLCYTQSI